MSETDLQIDYEGISRLGYDVVREGVFRVSHPQVGRWANFFEKRMKSKQIFERFENGSGPSSILKAEIVCREWHAFSNLTPWILCQAAAKVSTNQIRHYVIQTAFEELGARDVAEIHHELFLKSAITAGVPVKNDPASCTDFLDHLRATLLSANSDEEVIGLLLGLEVPARENVETIFESLAFSNDARVKLENCKFFQLHRQLEPEHIRLNVSMFLRFCRKTDSQAKYLKGFDSGLEFWEKFWSNTVQEIQIRSRGVR